MAQSNSVSHHTKDSYCNCTDMNNQSELVLKIRIHDPMDLDFIEIEIPRHKLSYSGLLEVCSRELDLDPKRIIRVRKLPDTRLRNDRDVQRLKDFQEIEIMCDTNMQGVDFSKSCKHSVAPTPVTPSNVYQSIYNKDQTILY